MSSEPLQKRAAHVGLRALAREMGISAPYLWDLENGNRPVSPTLRQRHARALGKFKVKQPNARAS